MYIEFRILNIYGPYLYRRKFWEGLITFSLFFGSNILVGGTFNFTFSLREVWVVHPFMDQG